MSTKFRVDKVDHNQRLARTVAWFTSQIEAEEYVLMVACDPLNIKFSYCITVEDME